MVGGRAAAGANGIGRLAEKPAGGNLRDRPQGRGGRQSRKPHAAAAIYPPLYRARLDRAIAGNRAMARRPRPCLDPQPGVYLLRADLALVLKLPVENITVEHLEGAGCYGHNGADDVALDAVLLAKAANGRPVRVQWSREDEMTHAPFGAAMAVEIEADLDANGEIVDWRHSIWGNGHVARPGRAALPALLAGTEIANPFPRTISTNPPQATGGGADRNSVPLYDFPSWQVECHRLLTMPIRTSALRTLGAQGNVFAIESFLDELACGRGDDPVAFRLRHLSDPRA